MTRARGWQWRQSHRAAGRNLTRRRGCNSLHRLRLTDRSWDYHSVFCDSAFLRLSRGVVVRLRWVLRERLVAGEIRLWLYRTSDTDSLLHLRTGSGLETRPAFVELAEEPAPSDSFRHALLDTPHNDVGGDAGRDRLPSAEVE